MPNSHDGSRSIPPKKRFAERALKNPPPTNMDMMFDLGRYQNTLPGPPASVSFSEQSLAPSAPSFASRHHTDSQNETPGPLMNQWLDVNLSADDLFQTYLGVEELESSNPMASLMKQSPDNGVASATTLVGKADDRTTGLSSAKPPPGLDFSFDQHMTPDTLALLLDMDTQAPVQSVPNHYDLESVSNRKFRRWTAKEDELLKFAVESQGGGANMINWELIANKYFRGSRNKYQCKGRWRKVSRLSSTVVVKGRPFNPLTFSSFVQQALKPDVNRTPFTAEEDEFIIRARSDGHSFSQIAQDLNGRSTDQIRDRFSQYLDPTLRQRSSEEWTQREDKILIDAQKRMGNKWKAISKLLPGRSANNVKNRWYNQQARRTFFRQNAHVDSSSSARDDDSN